MYLSCLCAAIFFPLGFRSDTCFTYLGHVVDKRGMCCWRRCGLLQDKRLKHNLQRKKIWYKSTFFVFFFFHSERLGLTRSDELPDSAAPDIPHTLARVSCRAWTADIDDWHTITARDIFYFYFTLRHRSRATLPANKGKSRPHRWAWKEENGKVSLIWLRASV